VALVFDRRPGFEDLPLQLQRQQRTLDVTWMLAHPTRSVFLTLMPLAQPTAAEGYLARIDAWARRNRGMALEEAGVINFVLQLDALAPAELLQQVRSICHVPDDAWSGSTGT
jgi:polysaccharide biosynthesis protein PelD